VLGNIKGLSDVITTVLIILVALAAVAIISGVVIKNVKQSEGRIEALQICQGLDITLLECNKDSTTPTSGTLKISRGTSDQPISKVKILFEDSAGDVELVIIPSTSLPAVYETSFVLYSGAPAAANKARLISVVQASDGTEYDCRASNVKIDCT